MNAQDLKNSILQLAIQGKLVEQRKGEGNAKELLEQIKAEKEQLIKEGKIKKEKPLPEITEDEIPFDIPESWKWVRLGNIVSILGDGIHGTPAFDDMGEYYFVNGNNLTDGIIEIKDNTKKVKYAEYMKYKKELNASTVFVSINGTIGNVAFYNNEKVILGKSACYFNLLLAELKFYLYWNIKTKCFLDYAVKNATGSTIRNVSLGTMKNFIIPLPPLEEQRRIVAKIEELMPYVEQYGEAYSKLEMFNKKFPEDMQKSILQYAIQGKLVEQREEEGTAKELMNQIKAEKEQMIKDGKIKKEKPLPAITEEEIPFDIPDSWELVRLVDVCTEFLVPQRDKPTEFSGEIPWCRIEDIEGKYLNGTKSNQYVSNQTIAKMNLKVNPVGTVICSCSASLGVQAIVTKPCCTNQTFIGLVPSSKIFNEYLYYYLKANKNYFYKIGSGTTIPYISKAKFQELILLLPPLEEQKRIVSKIEEMMPYCQQLVK